jgi:hypothetical protein
VTPTALIAHGVTITDLEAEIRRSREGVIHDSVNVVFRGKGR